MKNIFWIIVIAAVLYVGYDQYKKRQAEKEKEAAKDNAAKAAIAAAKALRKPGPVQTIPKATTAKTVLNVLTPPVVPPANTGLFSNDTPMVNLPPNLGTIPNIPLYALNI